MRWIWRHEPVGSWRPRSARRRELRLIGSCTTVKQERRPDWPETTEALQESGAREALRFGLPPEALRPALPADLRRSACHSGRARKNHDDGLWPESILEHREPERFRTIDEQAAAHMNSRRDGPASHKGRIKTELAPEWPRIRLARSLSPASPNGYPLLAVPGEQGSAKTCAAPSFLAASPEWVRERNRSRGSALRVGCTWLTRSRLQHGKKDPV
jgi:hypothetical protein